MVSSPIAIGVFVDLNDVLIFAGAALLGVGFGAVNTFGMGLAFTTVPHRDAATISAVGNVGVDSGAAIGASLTGVVAATSLGYSSAFLVFAIIAAVSVPVLLIPNQRALAGPPSRFEDVRPAVG